MKVLEKLEKEFNETNDMGKVIINNCLLPELELNQNFSERILLEGKTINSCLNNIGVWIRKSGNQAPSHDVVFSAAIHYYQEDEPEYVEELFKEQVIEFGR